jgi:uncharacterized protein YjiS (DUF1127 family)
MSPLFALPTHATTPAQAGTFVGGAIAAIKSLAFRLDAWLALRYKAALDREHLARMSDRELLDIGLPPLHTHETTAWWPADYPQ